MLATLYRRRTSAVIGPWTLRELLWYNDLW